MRGREREIKAKKTNRTKQEKTAEEATEQQLQLQTTKQTLKFKLRQAQ